MRKFHLQLFGEEGAAGEGAEAAVTEAETVTAEVPREVPRRYADLEPVLDAMAARFGVEAGDGKALMEAMNRQEQEARLRRQEGRVGRIYDGWMKEAEQLKQLYPDFELRAEMQNPQFVRLLRSRVDLRTAFEVAHHAQLLPAAMAYAAKTVEAKLVSAMGRGSTRPMENGIRDSGAFVMGSDVAGMSKAEIARMCRRVEKGERVSFG